MGIVALALAAGGIGYYAAVLHIVLHSFAKAGLFYHIGQVDRIYHSYWIKDTGNYIKINPLGAVVVLLIFMTVTAIPPSGLFVSELMVFQALFAGSHYVIAALALLLLSVIMFVFGRNFSQLLFSGSDPIQVTENVRVNKAETFSQFILIALIIYLAFDPPLFFTELINSAVAVLI
jgi:hydrogenase-4 component F